MPQTIDVSALTASLGAYYRTNGRILSLQTFVDLESEGIPVYTGIKDEEPMIHPVLGTILQPGGAEHGWNPTTGAFSFGDGTMKPRDWAIDLVIRPRVLEKTFLGRLTPPGSDPYRMDGSLEAMLIGHILKGIKRDLNLAVFEGEFNPAAVAAGAADPFRVIDGFIKRVVDELAEVSPQLTPVVTGAITPNNAVASLEAIYSAAHDSLKKLGGKMFMAPSILLMYNQDYRSKFGDVAYNDKFGKRYLELSENTVELVPKIGLAGSQRVIYDPQGVLGIGTDLESDMLNLTFEREKRDLIIFADGKIGTGIASFKVDGVEQIVVNDQA